MPALAQRSGRSCVAAHRRDCESREMLADFPHRYPQQCAHWRMHEIAAQAEPECDVRAFSRADLATALSPGNRWIRYGDSTPSRQRAITAGRSPSNSMRRRAPVLPSVLLGTTHSAPSWTSVNPIETISSRHNCGSKLRSTAVCSHDESQISRCDRNA